MWGQRRKLWAAREPPPPGPCAKWQTSSAVHANQRGVRHALEEFGHRLPKYRMLERGCYLDERSGTNFRV
jgi:hypothetical protein